MTAVLLCTARGAHGPAIVTVLGLPDEAPWVPARRVTPAHVYRCCECGRRWPLGARRMRALAQAVDAGELTGQIDLSMLA